MKIGLKRAYAPAKKTDGARILVERLWPRGLSKQSARLDLWAKDAAPSADLRRFFDHDPDRWAAFRKLYFEELDARPEALDGIRRLLDEGPVTFVFAAKEERFNNAVALRDYLLAAPRGSTR